MAKWKKEYIMHYTRPVWWQQASSRRTSDNGQYHVNCHHCRSSGEITGADLWPVPGGFLQHTCPEAITGTSSSEVRPMNATTVQQAKKNLDRLIEQVNADAEPTIICGDQGQKAVLLSLEEFNSWQETLYLLSNPANAEHLRQSIAEAQAGKTLDIIVNNSYRSKSSENLFISAL